MAAEKWDAAQGAFEELDRSKGRAFIEENPLYWVLAIYNLARCSEKQQKTRDTLSYYTRFVTIWKNADPGLPQVRDAKERLAKLRAPN